MILRNIQKLTNPNKLIYINQLIICLMNNNCSMKSIEFEMICKQDSIETKTIIHRIMKNVEVNFGIVTDKWKKVIPVKVILFKISRDIVSLE